MAGRLVGKRCLIVGGTSGIGLAAAQRFVAEGARVVITGLTAPESMPEGIVGCLPGDATQTADVTGAFQQTQALLGGLDVLLHAAGASGRGHGDGPLHDCTDDGWHWTLASNLTSVFLTNRAAIRAFLQQGQGGAIVNVASVLALAPAPKHFDTCAYVAAKGGILSLTRSAAARYATQGIRVNAIAPGLIDTPMAARAVQNPAIQSYLEAKQPLAQGPGRPEDCAEAALFLCSAEARLISGAVLCIDGGWCLSEGS